MRVIFLLPDLPRSGAATRTVHLAEHLVELGVSVDVATFLARIDSGLEARLRGSGIGVLRLTTGAGVRRLRQILSGGTDTVIHAAMPTAGLVGLCLARAYAHPMVYSFTNCLHTQRPFRQRSLLDHLKAALERLLASHSDALHAVSQSLAAQVRRSYPQAAMRTYAIVHPVTPPIQDNGDATVNSQAVADAYPKLLAVGRLLPHKRLADTIRAMGSVRLHWPQAMFVVLGVGPELDHLQSLIDELGLGDNVCLQGECPNPKVYFAWADMLLHPSLYEGYPRVVAEAQAMLLPVVSIDSPYGREVAHTHRANPARPPMRQRFSSEDHPHRNCPGPAAADQR